MSKKEIIITGAIGNKNNLESVYYCVFNTLGDLRLTTVSK